MVVFGFLNVMKAIDFTVWRQEASKMNLSLSTATMMPGMRRSCLDLDDAGMPYPSSHGLD